MIPLGRAREETAVRARRAYAGVTIIAALLCLTSTLHADDFQQGHAQAILIQQVIEDIIAADNAEDLQKVLAQYAEDAVLLTPSGPNVVGKEAIRAHYRRLFADSNFNITLQIDEITGTGNWAIARGVNEVVSTSAVNDRTTRVASKYLMSLRKFSNDRWRITHLMWSNQPLDGSPARRTQP